MSQPPEHRTMLFEYFASARVMLLLESPHVPRAAVAGVGPGDGQGGH